MTPKKRQELQVCKLVVETRILAPPPSLSRTIFFPKIHNFNNRYILRVSEARANYKEFAPAGG